MLKNKWLHDVKFDKYISPSINNDIDLSALLVQHHHQQQQQKQQQVLLLDQSKQRSHSFTDTIIEYHANNNNNNIKNNNSSVQMEYPNQNCSSSGGSSSSSKQIEQAFGLESMNSIRCSHLFDRCHRYADVWISNNSSKNIQNHCHFMPTENNPHRNESSSNFSNNSSSSSSCIHKQQPYNLSSTKFSNDDNVSIISISNMIEIRDDRNKVSCTSSNVRAPSKKRSQITAASCSMNGKSAMSSSASVLSWLSPLSRSPASTSAKLSLKFVHRSPLSIIHRANLLPIFIKYLLILNCFMCFVSGNLMARNIGNDLSSKHQSNHTNPIDSTVTVGMAAPVAGTTPYINNNNNNDNSSSNSPLHNNGSRKGTTMSPLILQSLISNNRSQLFQSASQLSSGVGNGGGGGGGISSSSSSRSSSNSDISSGSGIISANSAESERAKQFLQQHAQDPLTSGYVSDEPVSSFKVANADEASSEEFSRCASCQFREQLKAQNLASIKMHILARLSMTHPPNITGRPHISEQILQTFYQNNDFRYIRIRNGSNGGGGGGGSNSNPFFTDDDLNEMQGDDPNVSMGNQKHQHHHLRSHEYRGASDSGDGGGGGGGGIVGGGGNDEQHHHHQSSYHHHNRHTRYV